MKGVRLLNSLEGSAGDPRRDRWHTGTPAKVFFDLRLRDERDRDQRHFNGQVWRAAAQEGVDDKAFQEFMTTAG